MLYPHLFAARLRTSDPRWDQVTRRVIIVAAGEDDAIAHGDQLVARYLEEGNALARIDSRLENFCPVIPGWKDASAAMDWAALTTDDLRALWWCYGEPRGTDNPVALFGYVSANTQKQATGLWRSWVAEHAAGYRAGDALGRYPASCAITSAQKTIQRWQDILW